MKQKSKDFIKNFIKCFVFALVVTVILVIMDQEGVGYGLRGGATVPHQESELPRVFVIYFIFNFIVAIPLTKWLHWR
jgi:hypothetical protein